MNLTLSLRRRNGRFRALSCLVLDTKFKAFRNLYRCVDVGVDVDVNVNDGKGEREV